MSKVWGGMWHMSQDGISRKCYADPGKCYLGYHSDSEKGTYEKFENDSKVVKVKLPTVKKKDIQATPKTDKRELLLSKYGVTDKLSNSHSEEIESYSTNDIVFPGHQVSKKAKVYALNHKDYEKIILEKTMESREFLLINGRKRYLNKDEVGVMQYSKRRFDAIQGRVNLRGKKIMEINNSSNLAIMAKTGKSKKSLISRLEKNNKKDILELSKISQNHSKIYTEKTSSVKAILQNDSNDKRTSIDLNERDFDKATKDNSYLDNILKLFTSEK